MFHGQRSAWGQQEHYMNKSHNKIENLENIFPFYKYMFLNTVKYSLILTQFRHLIIPANEYNLYW